VNCSRQMGAETVTMPLLKYFGWMGSFLVAAPFAANWCSSMPIARSRPSDVDEALALLRPDRPEELVKFTLLTRGASEHLTDRYSERKEAAAKLADRMHLNEAL
jgi:hypothetical protein